MRINLRLNKKNDNDIIDALSNAKNVSAEVRKLLKQGIACGVSSYTILPNKINDDVRPEILQPSNITAESIEDIKKNLLSNDFGF